LQAVGELVLLGQGIIQDKAKAENKILETVLQMNVKMPRRAGDTSTRGTKNKIKPVRKREKGETRNLGSENTE